MHKIIKASIALTTTLLVLTTSAKILANTEIDDNLVRFAPKGMEGPPHFSVSIINKATGTINVSGKMALGANGEIVGKGDLLAQANYIYGNIASILDAAGTSPSNVIHQRVFIVDMDKKTLPIVKQAMMKFYGDGPKAASTTVGVETLLFPDALIEIEVIASGAKAPE